MKRLITIGAIASLTLSLTLLPSCSSDVNHEILKPISKHILGRWQLANGYMLSDGKWKPHDEAGEVSECVYNYQDNDSILICTTGSDGWSKYATIPYSIDEAKMTVITAPTESNVELLTADSLELVSDVVNNPETGEAFPEPIHYKWSFRRLPSGESSLGERLLGKWKLTGTEEKGDGGWKTSADAPTSSECIMTFTGNSLLFVDMVYEGAPLKQNYDWKINNATGVMDATSGEDVLNWRVEFIGNDKIWLYYTMTPEDGSTLELRDGFSRQTL